MPTGTPNDGWCELRLKTPGGTELQIATGNIYNYRAYWDAGVQANWIPITGGGTYTLEFVYRYNGDYLGGVLQTDIPIYILSSMGDPYIDVLDSLCYFTGYTDYTGRITHKCNAGDPATECTFVVNSPTTGTISVEISGGNPSGLTYFVSVERYSLFGGWSIVSQGSVGVLVPGTRWDVTSPPFNIEASANTGTSYRISLTYQLVAGGTMIKYSPEIVLHTGDQPSPVCPSCVLATQQCNTTTHLCECKSPCPSVGGVQYVCKGTACAAPSTTCPACNTLTQQCNTTTKLCECKNPCTSPQTCVGTACKDAGGGTGTCVGLNRDGKFDPTCIFEKGNEMYLYGVVGLLAVVLMSR
jgi:hypothetical protein